jgi:hypothetical protein
MLTSIQICIIKDNDTELYLYFRGPETAQSSTGVCLMRFRSLFRKGLVDVIVVIALFAIVEAVASLILFSRPVLAGSIHISASFFADRPAVFASGPYMSPSP